MFILRLKYIRNESTTGGVWHYEGYGTKVNAGFMINPIRDTIIPPSQIETGKDPGERRDIIEHIIKQHNLEEYIEDSIYDFM